MSLHVTDQPAPGTTAGIDWAKNDHAVCVLDADGQPVERVTITHTRAGMRRLAGLLERHRVTGVGIERPDGPVIDALLAAGHAIYVIPPSQVKALRRRYGPAGNKDDRFDAYVLADTVRTDRRRLTPLELDTEPARFTTQDAIDWLSAKRLAAWLASAGYSGHADPATLHARITEAPRGATGGYGQALAGITRAYLAALTTITAQIQALAQQITQAPHNHPDQAIFTSLPKAGTIRAARMLAEIGDARAGSPPPARWPAWPASRPPPASPARQPSSRSAGPLTNNSATPSATSPATAGTPIPGPLTSTAKPAPAATTTPTPSASSPAPGSASSGNAGPPAPPTTPATTTPSSACSAKINKRRLDTGQLTRAPFGRTLLPYR